jgi:hypothetical protein
MTNGEIDPRASSLRAALLDIHYGRTPEVNGWMRHVMLDDR